MIPETMIYNDFDANYTIASTRIDRVGSIVTVSMDGHTLSLELCVSMPSTARRILGNRMEAGKFGEFTHYHMAAAFEHAEEWSRHCWKNSVSA